jgi:nucleoside-diphosphate-sugar epimerase
MKKILIIGGSLFTGRVFSILAQRTGEFELHVANRGHYPLKLDGVTEYECDRHSPRLLERLLPDNIEFDATIDFCGYNAGDVAPIVETLGRRCGHYIFFSTASVYDPALRKVKKEGDPLVSGGGYGQAVDDYLEGKIDCENELVAAANACGLPYTILRPTFIYGPFNYAPRESYFIELISRKHVVPVPIDATARFSFVFVKDVANILMQLAGNEKAYGEVFNLSGPERVTYTSLIADFERFNGGAFLTREVTVDEVEREKIPLPFPLIDDDLTDGTKLTDTLGFNYTPFAEGMENTFHTFYSLYTN